jgi:UbiD family decarboxylase
MVIKDARHWLEVLEKEGELARIKTKVDWYLEIGAIAEEVFRKEGPALLFENIKDHENTFCRKFFTASLSTYPRIALMMGLPKDTPYPELIKVHRARMKKPIPPVIVKTGPVKENILMGDEVDMTALPAPHWHKRDGGRYVGTFDGVVTKDPETGWINVGLYRRMIHDKRHIGISVPTGQHIWQHFRKYKKMGKPMPVAVVNNWAPCLPAIACCPLPPQANEYDYMGALRQEPVELVKCETNDLLVPASAEIVYEGEISTDMSEFRMEGPFGEYTGYFASTSHLAPVFTVNCITFRNDPILQGTMEGIPINEDHRIESVNHSSVVWDRLDERMPGVTGVNVDASTGWANVFVQIDNSYLGQVYHVACGIWSNPLSFMVGNNVWVVDQDVDIYDLGQIMWAFAYRCDYKRDIHAFPGNISPLDPRTHPDERTRIAINKGWRVLFDCTKPVDWQRTPKWFGEKFAPLAAADEETLAKVRARWDEYGIGPGKKK